MHEKLERVIKSLKENLSNTFDDFQGMYLYGVHKDGKIHKNDDIEVVAIFDVENRYKREILWPIVGKIEIDNDVFIDLHPTTMSDLEKDEYLYDEAYKKGVFIQK